MLKKLLVPTLISAFSFLSASAATINDSNRFEDGPNDNWPRVITLTTASEGAVSRATQTLDINTTFILPVVAGCQYRVYKTTANGSDYISPPQTLALGSNLISVAGVNFDRTVKIQFSSGTVGFNSLAVNGETLVGAVTRSASMDNSYLFDAGPNATWTNVITLAKLSDGASSQSAQDLTLNITSLPAGGANYRVVKSTASGSYYNAPPVALTEGINPISVGGVSFDRAVKIQFSSGDIEFKDLRVNSTTQYPGPPQITLTGAASVEAPSGSTYTDQGATAVDDIGDSVIPVLDIARVSTASNPGATNLGSVDTSTVANYLLTYTATDVNGRSTTATRTVAVISSDTEAPVVTVNGQSSLTQTQGELFTDAGATVIDNSGETITAVVSGDTVDTSVPGVYTITYTATDSSGNSGSATRTVTVVEVDTDGDGVVDSLDVHAGFDDTALSAYLSTNGYAQDGLTQQDLLDARVGSVAVSVSGGTATISLQVEQSADGMQTWSSPAAGATTVDIPVTGDASFFRVRAQ